VENEQGDEWRQQGVVQAKSPVLGQQPEGQVLHGAVLADTEAARQVKQYGGEEQPAHCFLQEEVDSNLALTEGSLS
jgi:hypothetical protein